MAKVIQIRGVPDDVHAKLVEAADRAGKSLTAFVNDELAKVAESVDPVEYNRRVIAELRAEIGTIDVPRGRVQKILDEGREERTRQLVDGRRRTRA